MIYVCLAFVLTLVFALNTSDGLKIAVNDQMIVAVYNDRYNFAVQFASATTPCVSNFTNSSYIHSVALGKKSNGSTFAYIGEDRTTHQLFINSTTVYENCTFRPPDVFLFNFTDQAHFILAVHPTGQFLFVFSAAFVLIWEPDTQRSEIRSINTTLNHYAVDNNYDYIVIVGYTTTSLPVARLIYLNACDTLTAFENCMTTVDTFVYNISTTGNMSVKINDTGYVLWSIGSKLILLNIVNQTFNLINTLSFTNTIKALAWMGSDTFAALIPSQVLYYLTNMTLLSTFPNTWKKLCSTMSLNFDTIVSSDTIGLAILDVNQSVYVIRPTRPGYYPVTSTGCGQGIPFAFSNESPCSAGSYHHETSSRPCALCPPGTFNHGENSAECAPCNDSSFCPLGAVANVDGTAISSVLQAVAYPKSPDSTIYDDILLQNIFNLSFSRHCLLVSPVFWTIIVIIFAFLLLAIMGASKWFVRCANLRRTIKGVFKQTDLIGEGELWVGGIVSFSVLVLIGFAYVFSALYLRQYPIETSGDSTFACDTSQRNAKFSTQMQIIGIPLSDEIQPMFNMLDQQTYTLNVDFVNTLFHCQHVVIQQTVGTVVTIISPQNCSYHEAILYVSVLLPTHTIAIQLILNGTLTVGGMRVGLSGPEASEGEQYRVQNLDFKQSYWVSGRTLSANPSLQLQFIRLINATEPLVDGHETLFSALWIPTFSFVSDQLFLTETQYNGNARTQTLLAVSLSEKAYFVLNTQTPIAKQAEVVFHSILFTIVCLELFGLLFLIFKLLFVPVIKYIGTKLGHVPTADKYQSTTM